MADEWVIEVEKRELTGSGPARRLRRAGSVPGVLYGGGVESIPVSIPVKTLGTLMRSEHAENTLLKIQFKDSGDSCPALIREVQVDPLGEYILHADFLRVSMTETVEVNVPIDFQGTPIGVKDHGGIFDVIRHEIHVVCLPSDIPATLAVEVTALEIGDAVRLKDLPVPERVEILGEPDLTIAHVMPPIVVAEETTEEEDAAAAEEAEEGAEPEVIGKGKGEEGEEKGE